MSKLSYNSKDSEPASDVKAKEKLRALNNKSNIETIDEIPRDQRLIREYLDKNKFI